MTTHITTAHEEQYTASKLTMTLGVLLNYSSEPEHENWKDSLIYIFKEKDENGLEGGRYIFFNTMFDMWSYILYSENKMKIAYMDEDEFDSYYDALYIEGKFTEKLKWIG